jgi:hypothetical protein
MRKIRRATNNTPSDLKERKKEAGRLGSGARMLRESGKKENAGI